MSARTTALGALIACRTQNAWSDGVLREYIARDRLSRRDAALASRLCYGVMQNRILLDYYIAAHLTGKIKDLQPVVLDILRLGVYQITMTDKIPVSAAVNEAVEQGKKYANKRAAGLVNGVLRSVARAKEKDALPQPTELSVQYSHSPELVALLRENVGDELLEPLLKSHNEAPQTALQVNTLIADEKSVFLKLEEAGAEPKRHPWLPNCILVSGTGNLSALPAFKDGMVYVQDPAARLAVMAAGVKPGDMVLDACAAPGGKTFAAALEMENRGTIVSCDVHEHKLKLITAGAERLGISIAAPQLQDAREDRADFHERFDVVLADVPCSGLGVIRKKPDIRYKDLSEIAALPKIQSAILDCVAGYVRRGGALLYSTCTILRRENEDVANEFLARHPEFTAEPFSVPEGLSLPNDGMATLLPCVQGTDGFFICKLRKKR